MNFRMLLSTYVKNFVGLSIVVQVICKLFLVGWSFNSLIVLTHEHRMPLFVLNVFLNLFPQGFQIYIAKIFHLDCACFKPFYCLWGYCRTLSPCVCCWCIERLRIFVNLFFYHATLLKLLIVSRSFHVKFWWFLTYIIHFMNKEG